MTLNKYNEMVAKPKKPRKKATKPAPMSEDKLQEKVVEYITNTYPDVMFDGNSKNIKLEIWQGVAMKRMGKRRGYPDMFIAAPRHGYHGLYIELKRDGERVNKLDGKWANEHVAEQAKVHEKLRSEGYWADFVIGYEPAIEIIKWYLGGE